MTHINGQYEIIAHVADINSEKKVTWDLGTITIWFKEGLDSGNNQGINE